MQINPYSQAKKCVTFVFLKDGRNFYPIGTGFLVGKQREDSNEYYGYIVTAKHVLQDKKGVLRKTIYLRFNKHNGTSGFVRIRTNKMEIHIHEDTDIDIAVIPYAPDQKIYDFSFVPYSLIATSEILKKFKISEGDEVFFSGLFTSHPGQIKNQPIVRFGRVALMSDEKIEWREKGKPAKLLDLYLVECQSFGGNSGSPVFFSISAGRDLPDNLQLVSVSPPSVFLAGVMKGTYLSANELEMKDTSKTPFSIENLGIAAVTPSYFLNDIFLDKELR